MLESLRDIRLFIAVYEERSFTSAARRENATQSGVSQHIRKIEDRFGVTLFIRDMNAVSPTPAGEKYYRHCIEVLRANAAATRALTQYKAGLDGKITVGLMPTMTHCVLAPALAAFIDAHPNVTVRIVEAYSGTLTQQVRSCELDFAVVPGVSGVSGVRTSHFIRTPEVLVSSGGLPTEHLAPTRLSDLGPLSIVVPGRENTRRQSLETYFASHRVQIDRLLELDAMLGTLDLVATTGWVAILPGLMMSKDAQSGRYVINPLSGPDLETELVLVEPSRQPLSPAAQAFLECLEQEAQHLNSVWPSRLSNVQE